MASMNTRLNIEKLDGSIVQKHGGSNQVGFKQLGLGVETGVHDEKCVWFEVELQGAGWRTSNLKRRQTQTAWVAKHLGVAVIHQQNGLVDEINVTFFAKPIDMLGIFGWLASIKKGMLEPVKVKNMGFNESEEYKKTFIGSGVGTGSMQVLHGFEFEVELLGDHTFEVEPQENVNQGAGLLEVQTQDLIYYHLAHDKEQYLACELFGYREDINDAAFAVVVVEKIYAHESPTFNNTVASTVAGNAVTTAMAINGSIHQATKGLLDKAKGNVLGMEVVKNQSDYTSCVYAVRSQEYQMVCTRPNIASTDVGMLDGFDRGLQTYVQVFVDFDYVMGRSITAIGRSITRYRFMILGCAGSLKANLQHMEALPTTEAGYMTFTEAWKNKMWLKGLLTESRYELRLVAGIATGALYYTSPSVSLTMSGEDQVVDATALTKFDMPLYESKMTAKDVKSLAIRHDIPLDLHLVSKQGHWFSFEKRVGKGVGGQVFRETFSGLKGWKKRFFVLDRRAIPDAMAWRHHDSDVNDPVPEDGFSTSDVQTLTERVVDLRHRILTFTSPFAVVTMSGYLRFPFLSGASISKGPALTSQDQIEQHTTRPLPSGHDIPEKTDHQKRVEVEDPKIFATRERKARATAKKRERKRQGGDGGEGSRPATKRKKTVARKDGPAVSGATSSPEPLRIINPTDPSEIVAETAESREDRSPRVSPHGSANRSVHNYSDTHVNKETETLRIGTSGDHSGRIMTNVNTEVVQPSLMHRPAHHINVEARESSSRGSLYVPDWSIHQRCRLDTPMWCRELMVYLAPPATQEESNALNNAIALERAWFSLARGASAQTDILESSELSQVNKDQALWIKELEDELARKDSALVYAERLNAKRA
nr:transposase (putative), gypsy type [Tanacetum cinerariifolium]